ncbi:MAG: PQQ-binding-like beta-propeller repeat protein [Gemmataceae bacterium]|nr:PQQ-binding-like beta-propeller repeat protein [Gemmataceae bacterium]MBJ7344638.1 PQQ-binding-like beta-propeller repeat protein [Gemmataceae bacterium]MBJ7495877.1 PQQ-binding-like beta-propeller repeat protein [Gemmataceae bacterium]
MNLSSLSFGVLVLGLSSAFGFFPPVEPIKEWPFLGGSVERNQSNPFEKNIPAAWSIKKDARKNVKWAAEMGTVSYGGPTIADGKIFVGTNNERPRDPKAMGDRGVIMCFNEADGSFLWQITHDKLPEPELNDWPKQGIGSYPAYDQKKIYYVSNRCELVCASTELAQGKTEPAILWKIDMMKDLGVFPCFLAIGSPLVLGDNVFVVTANGVDPNQHKLPAPDAPSFIAVNKNTGKLAWKSSLPGKNIMEGQWSNPAAFTMNGKSQVIFPGGDGWVYSFEPVSGALLWKFDCNPKGTEFKPGGRGNKSYIMATPVIFEGRVYVGTGNNPDDGPGEGHFWCIDATKTPDNPEKDLSPKDEKFDPKADINKNSGLVWHYGGKVIPKPEQGREISFGRTLSTPAIHDGLIYLAELDGYLHCLDAKTGQKHWDHDLRDGTWASPYYVDGKVFIGTDSGDLYVFKHGKTKAEPTKIEMDQPIKGPVTVINGCLYVNTGTTLFAISGK